MASLVLVWTLDCVWPRKSQLTSIILEAQFLHLFIEIVVMIKQMLEFKVIQSECKAAFNVYSASL